MADMWYDKEAGGFVRKVPGTDRVIKMGGEEDLAMQKAYEDRERAFKKQHYYNRHKDYSGDYAKLFGADNNRDSELFYRGVGHNWRYALQDRTLNRGLPFGQWDNNGYYEDSSASIDQRDRAMMLRRNNAIEDMARRGYSQQQLNAHLSGERNILDEDPDWADYDRWKNENGVAGNWFINAPSSVTGANPNGVGNSGSAWGGGGQGSGSGVGTSGGAWGPAQQQTGNNQAQVNPQRLASEGLFSPENEVMRQFISKNLKSRLFGG